MKRPHVFLHHLFHYRHYLHRARQFVELMVKQYQQKQCQKSAASLTYVTLFATVPLMTVTYSMFSIIPAFQGLGQDLQTLIFAHLLPDTGQELVGYLQEFSNQARKLTVVGVIFLVISAYLMLRNIEENFNAIWGVKTARKGISSFLLYWAILSLGPLLLGVALAMSTYLVSLNLLMGEYDTQGLITWVFKLVPTLLGAAAFTLLFAAVPNCKVPLLHALIGGLVTAICFAVLRAIFSLIVTNSSITLIYGAFAILPLFLLWVNMIWMVLLGGAVFVHTMGIYQIVLKDRNYPDLLASLLVLWQFQQAAASGGSLTERELLRQGLSSEQWRRISDRLLKHRIITTTVQGDFVLSYDLNYLSLEQLAEALDIAHQLPVDEVALKNLPWHNAAKEHLGAIDDFTKARLAISVAELFAARNSDTEISNETALRE